MTDDDYAHKLDELDRLLNDPEVPMQPEKIWSLLAELERCDALVSGAAPSPAVSRDTRQGSPAAGHGSE